MANYVNKDTPYNLQVKCPTCHALAGKNCFRGNGLLYSSSYVHKARKIKADLKAFVKRQTLATL